MVKYMDNSGLKEYINKITGNQSLSIDDRIDEVLSLCQEIESTNEEEKLSNDILFLSELIDMVKRENEDNRYDEALLELLVILSERYVDQRNYRDLKYVAINALSILRSENVGVKVMNEVVPRLVSALEDSIYNHDLYEILVLYFKAIIESGEKLHKKLKPEAELMLKLHILLEDADEYGYQFDRNVGIMISKLFTSEELVEIIRHPAIGHLRVDPVEYTRMWEKIYYEVEDELDARFADTKRHMGFCFMYWNAKRDLLKKKYGIDWRSPSQMNPRVIFD